MLIGVLIIIIIVLGIYFMHRKILLATLPIINITQGIYEIDVLFKSHGWETKIDPSIQKIKVSKDTFVATDIYLREESADDIKVVSGSNTTELGWIVIIILIFGSSGVGSLIFILIIHYLSRRFAKNEIAPLLESYSFDDPNSINTANK